MADRGFIDKDMANRGARGGSSEGANTTRQSIRNNQVITGARAKATSPARPPLVRPTPPPVSVATDTSTPGNAAANIAAAIATRPTPPPAPIPIPTPPPVVIPPPPIFIPASIPDVQVQSTITPLGPTLISSGDLSNPGPGEAPGGNNQPVVTFSGPAPIQSLPIGPIDIEIITEGGSGGDEATNNQLPIPEDTRPAGIVGPGGRPQFTPSPPPIEFNPQPLPELIEEIVEIALQTPKEDPPAPVQTTVQIPEPKPSTPVVAPPRPKIKKSTDIPTPKVGYIQKPNGFIKKAQEPVVDIVYPPKVTGPGSPTKPGGLAGTLVGTGKPKVTAPTDDAGAVVGPQVSEPKPVVGTPGPKFKGCLLYTSDAADE